MSALFSHAALAAASRKAFRGSQGTIDLELGGPNRPEPLIMEDELEGGIFPSDLSVSPGALVRDVFPPAPAPSPEQEGFRRDLLDLVRSTFGASAASSTVRTCEATLRGVAPNVTMKLGSAALPMRSEAQFYSFFGVVLILGPKTTSPVTSQPGVRWNYVKFV